MTTTTQFWTLFRFQATINPYIWFMPIGFFSPLVFLSFGSMSLEFMISPQNLAFVAFIGVMVLAPEMFQSGASNPTTNIGTEFLLTRAVDRPLLCRARAAYFLGLIMLMPLLTFLFSLPQPTLKVEEYSKSARQQCLVAFPDSTVLPVTKGEPHTLLLPGGKQILGLWHLWLFLVVATGVEGLIYLLHGFKYRTYIFWTLFAALILGPFSASILSSSPNLSWIEHLFFAFASHPLPFWLGILPLAVLVQLWCERRFAQTEQ